MLLSPLPCGHPDTDTFHLNGSICLNDPKRLETMANLRPRPASRDGHGIVPEKEHTTSRLLKRIEAMPSHLCWKRLRKMWHPYRSQSPQCNQNTEIPEADHKRFNEHYELIELSYCNVCYKSELMHCIREQTRMKAWLQKAAAVTCRGSKYLKILTNYIQLLHADLP